MKKSIFVLLLALGWGVSSCNLPNGLPSQSDKMTAAALTIQAVLTPLSSPTIPALATPIVASPQTPISPSATNALTGTPTLTKTVTPTITPTYSIPMLTIKESVNCRSGPGQSYAIIFAYLPGASAEIVGQYPTDNYWIVKLPNSNDTCWIWGEYATATGSYWVVPTATIPPTATVSAPDAPSGLSLYYSCDYGGNITVSLNWNDNSDGEEGFRVIRNDVVVAELPPNSNSYTDIFSGSVTEKYSYVIETFNGKLTARSTPNKYSSFSCQ